MSIIQNGKAQGLERWEMWQLYARGKEYAFGMWRGDLRGIYQGLYVRDSLAIKFGVRVPFELLRRWYLEGKLRRWVSRTALVRMDFRSNVGFTKYAKELVIRERKEDT